MNSYLVRAIVGTRGIQALVNGFYYVFAALHDSVLRAKASNGKENDQKSGDQVLALDEVGNCALFALSQFYSIVIYPMISQYCVWRYTTVIG